MMKAIPQSLKPAFTKTLTKTTQPRKISVGLDVFGNAIPDVKSALVEDTGKALRIVKRQDMVVKPSRKRSRKQSAATSTALVPVTPTLLGLGRLVPWWTQQAANQKQAKTSDPVTATNVKPVDHPDGISERLEYAFKRLHQEFNEREQHIEDKMRELRAEHQNILATQPKTRAWILPVAVVGASAMGYMMYVMTSMQGSMTAMSGNINTMNGHIGTMANDTQAMSQNTQYMSQNMQTMNQSMYYMNNNVAYMSGNVAQMNQQVGSMAQSVRPMGEAASTVSPFMKMFKSFMPF
ncbi:MAG: hypothetical protein R3E93_09165 [Thiothrix sp.]